MLKCPKNLNRCPQIASFTKPTLHNVKTLHLLSSVKKKRHFGSWNLKILKKWKWFIFFQSTNRCISSCLCVLCILRWYIFKPNSEKSENPSCWSMAVCVVCCIFTFCVSQLQDMNTCLVGSGLLQGSSTSWPIHSVSPKPLRPLRVVVSLAFREARGKFVLMECDPETPSINTFFFLSWTQWIQGVSCL